MVETFTYCNNRKRTMSMYLFNSKERICSCVVKENQIIFERNGICNSPCQDSVFTWYTFRNDKFFWMPICRGRRTVRDISQNKPTITSADNRGLAVEASSELSVAKDRKVLKLKCVSSHWIKKVLFCQIDSSKRSPC